MSCALTRTSDAMRAKNNNKAGTAGHGRSSAEEPHAHVPTAETARSPALVWFYGLWVALAGLSSGLGHSNISTTGALFLLGGIVSTNFFFIALESAERHTPGLRELLGLYQTVLGIAWTTAYFYFSSGAADLVLGMYMTVLMFAVFHLSTRRLLGLSAAVISSYLLVLTLKFISDPQLVNPLADGVRYLVLIAIVGWIYLFARKLRDLRCALQDRNEELQNVVTRVTRIAEEDHLTKSFNRRHIMEVLAREKARADRSGHTFAVVLFDLDHFKSVNDRFGHLVGDQILADFATQVKHELRGMDSVKSTEHKRSFGRYGGEEFLAILPGSSASGAERCGERIRGLIAEHEFRDRYNITVSAGVAEYQLGETIPQLLKRADEALYQAKSDGRNRVRCSAQQRQASSETVPNLRILK